MGRVIEKVFAWWCRTMHDELMWPVMGCSRCRKCLRVHRVEWSNR
jgi:hypothetical protein